LKELFFIKNNERKYVGFSKNDEKSTDGDHFFPFADISDRWEGL